MTGAPASVFLAGAVSHQIQDGSLPIALAVAFAAGVFSFASPCVLPLVPGYLSYVTGMSSADLAGAEARRERAGAGAAASVVHVGTLTRADERLDLGARRRTAAHWSGGRVLAGGSLFILGFAAVFVTLGAAFGGLGGLLRAHETALTRGFGVLTILLGLAFAGAFRSSRIANRELRFHHVPALGLAGAPVLGMMFGLGWTPCIGPTLGAVLGLAASTGAAAQRGALLAFVYCLGLGLPFLAVGLAFRRAMAAIAVVKRHYRLVMVIGGGLLVVIGLLEVTGVWGQAIADLQIRLPATPPVL